MSDERTIYADNEYLSDLSMNWEKCCRTVFVDADLHCRTLAEAHSVVRHWATEYYGDDYPPATLRYLLAPAGQVRRRLHMQGYTPRSIRELWTRAHARHVSKMQELAAEFSDGAFWSEVQALQSLSFEAWAEQQGREFDYEHHMRFGGVFNVDLVDPFADLALHIDMREPEAVWMDLSDLYVDDFDVGLTVRENLARRNDEFDTIETGGNILVLTEGSSDARILMAAIGGMYPEFADLFGFVDFDGFKVEGGASLLVKMVKAFAGVRMEQRIIALFDNDAAGIEAKRSLDRIRLPSSIRTMVLPDAAIARNYPTLGPEGLRTMDVNGSACPIEMFLGEEALTGPDGRLRPVRWSSWNKSAQRYQGEIEDKSAATDVFLKSLAGRHAPRELRKRFPEMDRLLSELFEAFSDAAE